MRKQTHFKKVVSFALAAAMAVSVCTAALADETTNETTKESAASEQIETQSAGEPNNKAVMLTGETNPQDANVAYVDNDTSTTYKTLQDAITAATDQVVLTSNVTESVTIPAGKSIQLNLNDHKITNTADKHTITNNGTLTITGNGKVDNVSNGRAALYNAVGASATLNGGVFTRSEEAGKSSTDGGGNTYYTILNLGTLTVNSGVEVNQGKEGNGKFSSLVDNGWYNGKQNTTKAEARMIINGGKFSGGLNTIKNDDYGIMEINGGEIIGFAQAALMNNNVATITNGSFNGYDATDAIILNYFWDDTMDKGELTISGGTFLSMGNIPFLSGSNNEKEKVTITNGNFAGGIKNTAKGSVSISGGNFLDNIGATYLASGYTLKANDDGTYTVGEKTVDTKPATKAEDTEVAGKPEDIKSEDIKKEDVANAAGSTTIADSKDASVSDVSAAVKDAATVKVGNEEVKLDDSKVVDAAKEAIAKAVKDSTNAQNPADVFDQDAENKDITVVAVPKLVVEPKAAADNETDKSMTFDINMVYDVKATVADTVDKMNDQNTITLEKNKEMPAEQVPTVAISLDVSALEIPEGQKVFVRHVKENGEVYYYAADTTVENGIVKTITFVNPDGFSEFTVMANKTVTVTIDGKEYALSAADIGKGFEIAKKDYCDWKGVSFKGIEGVYTTLTKELYDKAANGQKLEGTNVFEQVWFPPEEPTPAPTAAPTATPAPVEVGPVTTAAPTATPDDSQYYTCTACGHHNWTATADGYKCDTCGHLETKQISGYKNVKGTYAPTASSAKTAATASTIPQTSDEMPIVPIAIIAIAALLGLGVAAYMKKKQT